MPQTGSTVRAFRMADDELWARFGELAEPDRSTVLREFIRWYVGEVAEPPRRPDGSA